MIKKTKNFNEPRLCIRKFFPKKKCFIFDHPAYRKHLIHLDQLQEEDLNPEFREQVADFCIYILSHSKAKTLSGGITVNGPRESLLLSFLTWMFLQPIIDNRSGRHEDYFWQMQSLMMPRKTHHKGHTVNFTSEPKLFLVLSSIHRSRWIKKKNSNLNSPPTSQLHFYEIPSRRGELLTKSGKGKYSMYVRLCFSP